MFKHEWIWIKNRGSNFANTVREPMKEHEHVLVFSDGSWTYNKQMQERAENGKARVKYSFNTVTQSENYRKFTKPQNSGTELRVPSSWQKFNTETGLHPTQKPVVLFEYLIKTYSNKGDVVLDNCIGSGTTAIAAHNLNRRWIGIELNSEYCELARKRIKAAQAQLRLPM
jgi:site-specific DNA-methyltransferase (adenine-specific)